jgi:hypothetical protein
LVKIANQPHLFIALYTKIQFSVAFFAKTKNKIPQAGSNKQQMQIYDYRHYLSIRERLITIILLDCRNFYSTKTTIMKKIGFPSIIAIFLLLTSCTKADLTGDWSWGGIGVIQFNTNRFDSTSLEFIKIPFNRYFIYKDASTGSTDSVYVTQNTVDLVLGQSVQGNPSTPVFYYETYVLTLKNSSGTGNQNWFNGFASCDSQYKPVPLFIDPDFILSNTQTNLPCFWFPFTSSGVLQYSLIPTLSIEGIQYNTVHKFSATNGLQPTHPNYLETTHYWVKGIGIIKKEIRTYNSVKTSLLVRYG